MKVADPPSTRLPKQRQRFDPGMPASMIIGVIGSFAFLALPLFVDAFAKLHLYSNVEVGELGALPLLGMFTGSFISAIFLARTKPLVAVLAGSAMFASSYFMSSIIYTNLILLGLFQFIGGVAGTMLMAIPFFAISRSESPDRNFAIFVILQLGAGAVGILFLGCIIQLEGLAGAFRALAFAGLVSVVFVPFLNSTQSPRQRHAPKASLKTIGTALFLIPLGQFLFGCGIMTVWSIASVIGSSRGWAPDLVAQALSLALATSIGGAIAAALFGGKFPRLVVLVASTTILCVAAATMALAGSFKPFMLATICFAFGWNVAPAFQLGLAADLDPSGRLGVLSLAGVKLGYAAGVALGSAVHNDDHYSWNALIAAAALISSVILFAAASRQAGVPSEAGI